MKKKMYLIELNNGNLMNVETPLKGFKKDVEEYAKSKFKDFRRLIRVKPEHVEPTISKERLNEFRRPLTDYYKGLFKSASDIAAETFADTNNTKKESFRTIGVITESDTFFNKKIAASSGTQLTKFVKISKEQHFEGHEFDFIFCDSYFDKRYELLHFYSLKNWKK
jgi:hypothetical protein